MLKCQNIRSLETSWTFRIPEPLIKNCRNLTEETQSQTRRPRVLGWNLCACLLLSSRLRGVYCALLRHLYWLLSAFWTFWEPQPQKLSALFLLTGLNIQVSYPLYWVSSEIITRLVPWHTSWHIWNKPCLTCNPFANSRGHSRGARR